jgi:hypothetical protein
MSVRALACMTQNRSFASDYQQPSSRHSFMSAALPSFERSSMDTHRSVSQDVKLEFIGPATA